MHQAIVILDITPVSTEINGVLTKHGFDYLTHGFAFEELFDWYFMESLSRVLDMRVDRGYRITPKEINSKEFMLDQHMLAYTEIYQFIDPMIEQLLGHQFIEGLRTGQLKAILTFKDLIIVRSSMGLVKP